MKEAIETLGASGFYCILAWYGGLSNIQAWWEGEGFTPTECFERNDFYYDLVPEYSDAFYTGSVGIPLHMLIDRDGNVRKASLEVVSLPDEIDDWIDDISTLI